MRQEHRHHTDDQIREAIAFGIEVATGPNVPPILRVEAFKCAVNLRTAKSIVELAPQTAIVQGLELPR